ncbi:MAG: hypothetical protein JO279_09380 [Verrucomicrobia bacterium]|nr:hypothetical protein [Verrucomicrobiota bacterium]
MAVRKTGARIYMHPLDVPMVENGGPLRPLGAAPGRLIVASRTLGAGPLAVFREVICPLRYPPL